MTRDVLIDTQGRGKENPGRQKQLGFSSVLVRYARRYTTL